jgi:hypothetical protein
MSERTRMKNVEVTLIGHEPNERSLVVQVPADWTDDDIQRLPIDDLECWGDLQWDVVEGGVVAHAVRVEGELSPEAEPDVVFRTMPKEGVTLSASRRAKLVLFKILEYAEIGGMAADDCGLVYEAVSNCLDGICVEEGDESTMKGLIDQMQQILVAENWKQRMGQS